MEVTQIWFDEFFSAVGDNDILKRRESNTIEFKEHFNWNDKKFKSMISRTAAAFSNNAGGIIIFGVADKPHTILGIEDFDETDEAAIATWFNEHFSPSIDFSKHTFEYHEKTIGCIQINEAINKPIVCIKDSVSTNDSEVYYRYSAMSSRIKSGDLIYLLNQVKQEVTSKWLSTIEKIATIGVGNVGLLNSTSGELISSNNQTYILDETILDQIKFLDQYSEAEEGAPAIKIVGEIEEAAKIIEKAKTLYEEDIYKAFLSQDMIAIGSEYIAFIMRQNSPIYPIYWFLNQSDIPTDNRKEFVSSIKTRSKNKDKVVARLEDDSSIELKRGKYTLNETKLGLLRKTYHEQLCRKENISIHTEEEAKALFETLFSLQNGEFDIMFVKKQLLTVYKTFYPFKKDAINFLFRWAITYLDNLVYKNA